MMDLKSVNISTHPPFDDVIKSIEACQNGEAVALTKSALDVYMRVLDSILSNAALLADVPDDGRRERLRRNVGQLTKKLRHLSAVLARPRCTDAAKVLQKLTQLKVQVDDVMFQKRALSQFLEVYNMATVIGSRALAPPTEVSP
ncbi:uncharacterized protein LOC144004268 isoform X2 [Festucalex cinctus]